MTATNYTDAEIAEIRSNIAKGSHAEYATVIKNAPAWWIIKYRFAWLKVSRKNPDRDRAIYAKWIKEIEYCSEK